MESSNEKFSINHDNNNSQIVNQTHEQLIMYWIDAIEDKINHPGTVYLIGKVKNYNNKYLFINRFGKKKLTHLKVVV